MQQPANNRQFSIKTKVALATFLTVFIVLTSVASSLFFYFHNLLRDNIFQQQFVMVSEVAAQLEGRIQLARHQLSLAATEFNSKILNDPDELNDALTHISSISMIFDAGILVIGTDGRVIAESMEFSGLVGEDLSFRDYVKEPLRSGKPYISLPFRAITPQHNPMIAMTIPVRDTDDRILCLLVGYHSLGKGQFLTSLSTSGLGSSGYLYLLQDRTIIMHPDSSRILETIPEGKNRGIDLAQQGFEGSLENVNSKGLHLLSSFKKVGDVNWILASNIPYKDAFIPLYKLSINAALISAGGLILSLLVVWYVTRRMTRPIKQLIAHVDGGYNADGIWKPLELHSGDELERLANAFNRMMSDILQAQQRLKNEKVFVENLINSASTPMFVIDGDHRVQYWNRSLEIITGRNAGDIKGSNLHWSGFYDAPRSTLADLVLDGNMQLDGLYGKYSPSKYIEGGFQAEGWFDIGGRHRYLFFEAAPIRNADGIIIAAIESLEDISERRQLEDSLSRLSRAVDQSPATIVMTGRDGTIEYVNPKFCQTTGYSVDEALGKNPRVLKSGEMSADNYALLWNTITSGKEWRGEFHNKRKDGTLYWEFASISPLFDTEGLISGYLAVKEDITERKMVELELARNRHELEAKHAELEDLFRKVARGKREWEETLDHLQDFVILTDAEHHVRRFNRLLADITGRDIASLEGLTWQDILTDAGFHFVHYTGKTGELHHDRLGRIYDINVYGIHTDDILEGYVISIHDSTDLRAATRELEKTYSQLKDAQLQIFQQEKMASIGQLAAGVAHEINNPMGFISSNLNTLTKYFERMSEFINASDQALLACNCEADSVSLAEKRRRLKIDLILGDARQLISESQEGAGRVRRIVQDLRSFSRVDQSSQGLVNLNEALETTINIAWNELKSVTVFNREFGEIPDIVCYPQQLNQVFLNLLVNAGHAMEGKQGSITVRTWCEKEDVFVSVTDTGCGIADENIQRIFEPFFTTKEVGKGTGLGLSVSYDIIRKHGGELTVSSEAGSGTCFTVRLPVAGVPRQMEE